MQIRCAGCGTVLRIQPKTPGVCPYCGGSITTGRNSFQGLESAPEPPAVRNERRRKTRIQGLLQLVAGLILIAILAPGRRPIPTFFAGLLAAHGLFRLLFASGPNRDDDDYDKE